MLTLTTIECRFTSLKGVVEGDSLIKRGGVLSVSLIRGLKFVVRYRFW